MKSKKLKTINVKGSVVHGKDKTFIRDPYIKQMQVNDDLKVTKINKSSLQHKDIKSVKNLEQEDGGISDGVSLVEFNDNSKAYFKPINGEPFVSGGQDIQAQPGLNFQSYHLNDKSGKKLSTDDHNKFMAEKGAGRGTVTGHMVDREAATSFIGKALGMDNMPDIAIREIDGQVGALSSDLIQAHSGDDVDFIKKYTITTGNPGFAAIAKTDNKAGDKALFDFIVGNADRHGGNFLHKQDKNGISTMLAFDHGFTFPSSNSLYQAIDYHNQAEFDNAMKNVKFTPEFVDRVKKFASSEERKKISKFISSNIGVKEAAAFEERISFVNEKINNNANTTNDVDYRNERFMT